MSYYFYIIKNYVHYNNNIMFCYISLIILGFSNLMFEKQPPIIDPSYPSQILFNRFKPNCTWKMIGMGERAALVCSRRVSNVFFSNLEKKKKIADSECIERIELTCMFIGWYFTKFMCLLCHWNEILHHTIIYVDLLVTVITIIQL